MIYGYARVSSAGQAIDGNSLESQEEALKAAGATKIFKEVYTGTKMERKELDKLEAFLRLYVKGLSGPAGEAISGLWRAWNAGEIMADHWQSTRKHWPELEKHAQAWCLEQALQADLATALVQFYVNWI